MTSAYKSVKLELELKMVIMIGTSQDEAPLKLFTGTSYLVAVWERFYRLI